MFSQAYRPLTLACAQRSTQVHDRSARPGPWLHAYDYTDDRGCSAGNNHNCRALAAQSVTSAVSRPCGDGVIHTIINTWQLFPCFAVSTNVAGVRNILLHINWQFQSSSAIYRKRNHLLVLVLVDDGLRSSQPVKFLQNGETRISISFACNNTCEGIEVRMVR